MLHVVYGSEELSLFFFSTEIFSQKVIMKFWGFFVMLALMASGFCDRQNRPPLTYAQLPVNVYKPLKNSSVITLLDFVKSRSDLTTLASVLANCGGLCPFILLESPSQPFDTACRLSSSI